MWEEAPRGPGREAIPWLRARAWGRLASVVCHSSRAHVIAAVVFFGCGAVYGVACLWARGDALPPTGHVGRGCVGEGKCGVKHRGVQ